MKARTDGANLQIPLFTSFQLHHAKFLRSQECTAFTWMRDVTVTMNYALKSALRHVT